MCLLRKLVWAVVLVAGVGCTGAVTDETPGDTAVRSSNSESTPQQPSAPEQPDSPPEVDASEALTSPVGLGSTAPRRLSNAEYVAAINQLTGRDVSDAVSVLIDSVPFDNDYDALDTGEVYVSVVSQVAEQLGLEFETNLDFRQSIHRCNGAAEPLACLESLTRSFGKQALRRPITDEEASRILTVVEPELEAGYPVAGAMVVEFFLSHMEFLQRVEVGVGEVENQATRLSSHEIASRIAFLATGAPPDEAIIDDASTRDFADADVRAEVLRRLFETEAGLRAAQRFHAMWLGYTTTPFDEQASARFQSEANAMVSRVIEENRPWADLFTLDETFVDEETALHYGLDGHSGGESQWVKFGEDRAGVLSTTAFLSNGTNFGDTSPTQRGKFIRNRILCEEVMELTSETAEAIGAEVDSRPASDDPSLCEKRDLWPVNQPSCAGCHTLMDPIGFGLENYGQNGAYRATEPDNNRCSISGDGRVTGTSMGEVAFSGPGELSKALIQTAEMQRCMAAMVLTNAMGGHEEATSGASQVLRAAGGTDKPYYATLEALVRSDAFIYRWVGGQQ